ncbi:serine/threonine-protein kinase SBK2-like [Onychomys torridus]|uniref:serine/threonine-protein kinase SBK2-like n=1 Tax=Onychomys torridus TaxID=38674 RepID=UPI00167FA913|nr:serine/threonine-protein kinase SBK2-like [Onychomys torridus]
MPGKQSEDGVVEAAAVEDGGDEGLGGLTVEELAQGQETALALEDMMALSAQTLVRTDVEELYEEVRPLGQGRFGRVLLVTHRQKAIIITFIIHSTIIIPFTITATDTISTIIILSPPSQSHHRIAFTIITIIVTFTINTILTANTPSPPTSLYYQ